MNYPKTVKEIKNLNEFIRSAREIETNKYWSNILYDCSSANYADWTRRESRLKWKREMIQKYLDYKNNKLEESFNLVTDSEGNELSVAQQQFFRNSKVRDNNGKLLVTVHYTSKDFNIFDRKKIGSAGNGNWSGDGFYFTSKDDFIFSGIIPHTRKIYTYLNIIKPFYYDRKTPDDVIQYLNKFELNGFFSKHISEFGFEAIDAIKFELKLSVSEVLQKLGYDGVIAEGRKEYMVFNSNQIKSIDNKNPSNNDNINESKLEEKASIDWNNYLTPEEVRKFLSKDDKVESAENIIYSKEFEPRYKDFHNPLQAEYNNSWTRKELIQDLVSFYNFGHLITESKQKIEEASRNELLYQAKRQTISRYNRSEGYKGFYIYDIDVSGLFTKESTLLVVCKVGQYHTQLELQDMLYWVQITAEENKDRQINTKNVTKALMNAIDGMDIKVNCECGDWIYRFSYMATQLRI